MFRDVVVGIGATPNGRDAVALAEQLAGAGARLTLSDADALGLCRLAARRRADLIVIGTHALLRDVPCAVAVAPAGYAARRRAIATVGVGYNGSSDSTAALALGRRLACAHDAEIRALEVVGTHRGRAARLAYVDVGETVDALLSDARERLSHLDGVAGCAVYGIAGEELAAFGEEVDLLVVGSGQRSGVRRRLSLADTSEYLELHARCPLLVLPRAARATSRSAAYRLAPFRPASLVGLPQRLRDRDGPACSWAAEADEQDVRSSRQRLRAARHG